MAAALVLRKGGSPGDFFIGGKYDVKSRDSMAKSIPKLLLESAMFVRILARIRKGEKLPIQF
jgi:hypothetical protein